jgi:hypothetical protein
MMTATLRPDVDSWWLTIAACFASLAIWAASHEQPPLSPEQAMIDLTARLRDPQRRRAWAVRHPIKAWHSQ